MIEWGYFSQRVHPKPWLIVVLGFYKSPLKTFSRDDINKVTVAYVVQMRVSSLNVICGDYSGIALRLKVKHQLTGTRCNSENKTADC